MTISVSGSVSLGSAAQKQTSTPYTYTGQKQDSTSDNATPAVTKKQEASPAKEDIPREQVEKAADKLNRLMGIIDKRLSFSVDKQSDQVVVKVIDQSTGKVIDQIPAKNMLDMLDNLNNTVGLLVDKWA